MGSDDDSYLDIYSFSLDKQTELEFNLKSNDLETVLIVADEDLNYLTSDTDVTNDCNALLKTELTSGNYFLIVNKSKRHRSGNWIEKFVHISKIQLIL